MYIEPASARSVVQHAESPAHSITCDTVLQDHTELIQHVALNSTHVIPIQQQKWLIDLIHILRGYMIHESKKEDPKALVFSGDFGDITDEQTRQTVHINVLDQLQRKFLARNKDGNHLFEVIDVQYPKETGGTVDAQQEPVLVKVVEKRWYPLHDRTGILVVNT